MDPIVIGAVITAVGVVVAALVAGWLRKGSLNSDTPLMSNSVDKPDDKTKSYTSDDIHFALLKVAENLEEMRDVPDVIISVTGSGGIVANWFKKILESKTKRRWLLFEVHLQRIDEEWIFDPPNCEKIRTARWILHIPQFLSELPKDKKIAILDSTYVTGTTIEALREFFINNGFSKPIVVCLVRVKQPGPTTLEPPEIVTLETVENPNFNYPWGPGS